MFIVCLLQGKSWPVLPALYDAQRALGTGRFLTSIYFEWSEYEHYSSPKAFSDHSVSKCALHATVSCWVLSGCFRVQVQGSCAHNHTCVKPPRVTVLSAFHDWKTCWKLPLWKKPETSLPIQISYFNYAVSGTPTRLLGTRHFSQTLLHGRFIRRSKRVRSEWNAY